MTNDLEQIGLAAVDSFIETWNSRDAVAWAGSLNFPHVRPAPRGRILVAQDADEYVSRVDFARVVETGWDHSEWDYKHVLHTSPRKIHVVGQWSRYNAEGDKILTNPVVYIVTRQNGQWGIQSRFSADHPGEEDTTAMESRSFKLIETFCAHVNNGNRPAAAELLNYPHFAIAVGDVGESKSASDFQLPENGFAIDSMVAVQPGLRSVNVALDVTVNAGSEGRALQAVVNVTERDDHLGIQAWSLLDPNEEDEE